MSDFRIDQISNQAGTAGPDIAGITTFSSTSGMLMPSGDTRYRYFYGKENIVTNEISLWLDAGNKTSYPGSGTTWTDLSGNGNNGTLVNGVGFNSGNAGSLVFDGVNDYISSNFTFTAGQAVTISGWLYSTASTSEYKNFVDTLSARPMIWWNTSGQIEFDIDGYTTPLVYRNQWVYVALVKPSGTSTASYYINGELLSTGGASYSVPANTPTWFNRSGGLTWIGNCSNVSVYSRTLTQQEILQNFNALRSRYGV